MNESVGNAWLAFDIGARAHTWALAYTGHRETGTSENDPAALRTFLQGCLGKGGRLRVLAEATGIDYLDVVLLAHELGAEVIVINPRTAHHFAQALNQRNKTDRLDAKTLLECLQRMPFRAWEPPPQASLALRSYGRFLVQLTEDGTAARNRLHALSSTRTSPALLCTELKRMLAANQRCIERIRAKAVALIQADAYRNERFEVLTTIKGVVQVAAVSILSELITLPRTLSSRACVCHAGLDVRVYGSGTSVHKAPRISRHGNKYLRRALFHPALSASIHDPASAAFKARLLARGKKKMQANVAIMRKLLTAAWAMMKNPAPYYPARLYATVENP